MKILVACCAIDYNQRGTDGSGFVSSLVRMFQGWDGLPEELEFFEVWRMALQMAQDSCVQYAMKHDFTHILFIEDDTTKIPDGALRKLLNHDKDIVSAFAYCRHFPYYPTIFRKGKGQESIPWTDFLGPQSILVTPRTGLRRVEMLPFQFSLMKVEVFERVTEPWFEFFRKINGYGATDQFFAEKCLEAGVELWCDTDIIVQHAGIDENTAGFHIWKEVNKDAVGKWMPAGSVPFLRNVGVDAIAEEEYLNVHSKV